MLYIEEFDWYFSADEWLDFIKDGCTDCGAPFTNPDHVGLVESDGSIFCKNCQ